MEKSPPQLQVPYEPISVRIEMIPLRPLPVVEEIWEAWGGKDELLKFNERASMGLEFYHKALLTEGHGKEAKMVSFDSQLFDSHAGANRELTNLLKVVNDAILQRIYPMTCLGT